MKALGGMLIVLLLAACQKSEVVSVYTGNQATYGLVQASNYAVSGTVTFKERKDGTTSIAVQLKGTSGTTQLPVHLHLGDVSANGAGVAAILNPVSAATGVSETILTQLADETKVTYKDLINLSAYLNVHAALAGPQSSVILAAGNIGANGTKMMARQQIGNCLTP